MIQIVTHTAPTAEPTNSALLALNRTLGQPNHAPCPGSAASPWKQGDAASASPPAAPASSPASPESDLEMEEKIRLRMKQAYKVAKAMAAKKKEQKDR